ncbi:DUF3892 domain-containing protein [Mucilaginibacter sp.]|jgi:hypothetical protein|uniref:DUF3892 domain-containing protein n=1 Tax=Mucilaginibacter sp. TaxID=1882438 RepID=UPI002B7C28AB|nr:DUF3892 domain-containing protein [Mucilaginibacter sp.]HTI59227.1 DUF3892 domain-containing protein [Mucilaginibacter sp.]
MAVLRQVSCISKRNYYFDPHEIIKSFGGQYLGFPWELPDFMVLHYIKTGMEKYYVQSGERKLKIVIAWHNGKEYLKAETDDYSPDTLLALPDCDVLKIVE